MSTLVIHCLSFPKFTIAIIDSKHSYTSHTIDNCPTHSVVFRVNIRNTHILQDFPLFILYTSTRFVNILLSILMDPIIDILLHANFYTNPITA